MGGGRDHVWECTCEEVGRRGGSALDVSADCARQLSLEAVLRPILRAILRMVGRGQRGEREGRKGGSLLRCAAATWHLPRPCLNPACLGLVLQRARDPTDRVS